MVSLTVLILTHNESLHIERCIDSFAGLTDKFFIVDSFSTDNTRERAEAKGAKVVTNPWVSYAFQFNYAIENNPYQTKWVMRMDADEYITPELKEELQTLLSGDIQIGRASSRERGVG